MITDFRRNKTRIPFTEIKGEPTERITDYKYLGIETDNKLGFINVVNQSAICYSSDSSFSGN